MTRGVQSSLRLAVGHTVYGWIVALRQWEKQEVRSERTTAKQENGFPDVCTGQTWIFPTLPGPLKAVVGKGLGRCSNYPFPNPWDIPASVIQPRNFWGRLKAAGPEVVVG